MATKTFFFQIKYSGSKHMTSSVEIHMYRSTQITDKQASVMIPKRRFHASHQCGHHASVEVVRVG